MESSSSFVQHHEISDAFLQPFSFNEEAEHHVVECSGKKARRRARSGEIEASEFDIKRFERESITHVGFGVHHTAGRIADWFGILISHALGDR